MKATIDTIMRPKHVPSDAERRAALAIILAISEAIRELGQVPAGELYAVMMAKGMTLAQFEAIIGQLEGAKLVRRESSHLLTWIGPHGGVK